MSEKVRVFLSAPGQEALTTLYGVALQNPRLSVVGLAPTVELLEAQLPTASAEVAVVDAELLIGKGEKGLMQFLAAKHGVRPSSCSSPRGWNRCALRCSTWTECGKCSPSP